MLSGAFTVLMPTTTLGKYLRLNQTTPNGNQFIERFLDWESSLCQTWRPEKNHTRLKIYFSGFDRKVYIKFLHLHPPQRHLLWQDPLWWLQHPSPAGKQMKRQINKTCSLNHIINSSQNMSTNCFCKCQLLILDPQQARLNTLSGQGVLNI